jgi:hypothetical protein
MKNSRMQLVTPSTLSWQLAAHGLSAKGRHSNYHIVITGKNIYLINKMGKNTTERIYTPTGNDRLKQCKSMANRWDGRI